ncbi:MAG: D-alanyl-D-alanine carboxypeptidase family protein [Ilumatobacteraceae bacterium]
MQPDLTPSATPFFVDRSTNGLTLRPSEHLDVDLWSLDALLDEAERADRSGDPAGVLDATARAAPLWRGDPLPDLPDQPWATAERSRLAGRMARVGHRAAELELARGHPDEAAARAETVLRADSIHRGAHRLLVRARARPRRRRRGAPRPTTVCRRARRRRPATRPGRRRARPPGLLMARRQPPVTSREPAGPRAARRVTRRQARRRLAVIAGLLAVIVVGAVVLLAGRGGTATGEAGELGTTTTTLPSIDAPGSPWWIVNAGRPLPDGYVPADLVVPDVPIEPGADATQLTASTARAFEALVADARAAGYELQLNSGYRSFDDQARLRARYVADYGEATAARLVARPGTSEHQTGMAVDVGLVGLPDDQTFGTTAASRWVADNAHRFGFIRRYPPDKAAITGYANEPWHLRFVGVELATELHASDLTMEERFGLAG